MVVSQYYIVHKTTMSLSGASTGWRIKSGTYMPYIYVDIWSAMLLHRIDFRYCCEVQTCRVLFDQLYNCISTVQSICSMAV